LISAAFGGTYIQSFTSPDSLSKCPTSSIAQTLAQNYPSGVYNAMIYPWLNTNFLAVLWYQGEANLGETELYKCLFPNLVRDWRNKFINNEFYFGIIQF
jgi:sialate O-acetylesterase